MNLLEKRYSRIPQFPKQDESAIDFEIQRIPAKGVITKGEHESGE